MSQGHGEKRILEAGPASTEGSKRRRADYLLLEYLRRVEVASQRELEMAVREVAKKLASEGHEVPVYFHQSSGVNGHHSRELNEALDRCIHMNRIEDTTDGKYGITDAGLKYLNDEKKLRRHGIEDGFRTVVRETAEKFA
jgi:hypothetical protein